MLLDRAQAILTHSRGGLLAGAAAAAGVLVYLNALHNPFVYDDYHTVVNNPSIARLGNLPAIVWHDVTRPIVNLSYAIDRRVWGSPPFGFHVTNVALHALDVVLLFIFAWNVYALAPRRDAADASAPDPVIPAFAAAILFAVHPMMTEAVGYISGRSEVLCGLFFLLAMIAGMRWLRAGGMPWAAATIALWACALATKEIGALFPAVLVCCDEFVNGPDRDQRRRHWKTVHGPLVGLAAIAATVRLILLARVEAPGGAAIHWPYALIALDVIRRYFVLLVNPRDQTIFHAIPPVDLHQPGAVLSILSVVMLAALALSLRRTAGVVGFGLLWFLLLLVPGGVLTTLNIGEPMAEHRVYVASCGLFLAAGDGVGRLRDWCRRTGRRAAAVVPVLLTLLVGAFALQTLSRNAVWRDPVTLWRESVDLAPAHYRPRLLLGEALQDAGRPYDAAREYQTAIQLRPKDPIGYNKLGALFAAMGRTSDARQMFAAALDVDPRDQTARRALTIIDRAEPRSGPRGSRR